MIRTVELAFDNPGRRPPVKREHLCLHYRIAPCPQTQTRFRGRFFAEPQIDLSQYEFKCVFDWIEVFVETQEEHSSRNLHRMIEALNKRHRAFSACFVSGPARDVGAVGRGHVIRMQNPVPGALYGLLRALLAARCAPGCKLADIPVTGVEVSLDVYPAARLCSGEADYVSKRMVMTELLRKHIAVNEAFRATRRRPRFTFQSGSKVQTQKLIDPAGKGVYRLRKDAKEAGLCKDDLASLDPRYHYQPVMDATFYFGKRGERLHYRLMDKVTDRREGDEADDLESEDTRSRVEFTLLDEAPGDGAGPKSAGLEHVADLVTFNMTAFSGFLLFELPTFRPDAHDPDHADVTQWEIFARTGIAGLSPGEHAHAVLTRDREGLRAHQREATLSSGRNLRYSGLNTRVSKALRRLRDLWAKV